MSWRITPTYTPNYPTSPTNGQTYTDPNTGIIWVYSTGTQLLVGAALSPVVAVARRWLRPVVECSRLDA
jgi:hypothetical protein